MQVLPRWTVTLCVYNLWSEQLQARSNSIPYNIYFFPFLLRWHIKLIWCVLFFRPTVFRIIKRRHRRRRPKAKSRERETGAYNSKVVNISWQNTLSALCVCVCVSSSFKTIGVGGKLVMARYFFFFFFGVQRRPDFEDTHSQIMDLHFHSLTSRGRRALDTKVYFIFIFFSTEKYKNKGADGKGFFCFRC